MYKERKRSLTRNNDRKIQEERYEVKERQSKKIDKELAEN